MRRSGGPLRLGVVVVVEMGVIWFGRDMATQVGSSSEIYGEMVIFGMVRRYNWDWDWA